ncbi:MAG TPA: protein kinase, partial [Polyangiaceae bacterium]|nr:protein kinase [Polyangiaceae bacterium]
EKFRAEGELLFRLSAAIPAVVRPLHLGTVMSPKASFVPFIALEWLDGRNLDAFIEARRRLGKPPLDLKRAVQLLAPAARALEQAHDFPAPDGRVSILHRDLKPENLFVVDVHGRETIKVLDFGIGKVKGAATQIVGHVSLDQSSFNAFTPAYGAPEQWLPKHFGQTGTWTDVWGFALTMVELVTATTPLDGEAHAVMGAAIDERLRPTPRSFGVQTSDAVEAIFQKALAVDPKQRYHDIGEFWNELEAEVGVSSTKIFGTPKLSVSPEPASDARRVAGEVPTLMDRRRLGELVIPDLDDGCAVVAQPPHRPEPGRAPVLASLDEFAEVQTGSKAADIPNIGGFRMDVGPLAEAIELGEVAREERPRPVVAHTVAIVQPRRGSFLQEVSGSLKLLALAASIMALDWGYTLVTGASFQVGPARAFWLAAPLAVFGIVKLLFRLFDH